MFREDLVPECRSTAHPPHTDKRRWMEVVGETNEFVVFCCRRCTEIARVPAIQVRVLPRGQARARYAINPQNRPIAPPAVRSIRGLRTVKELPGGREL